MSYTLLETIEAVTNEIGIDEPNAVASSTNLQVKQLLAFYNRVGKDLVRDYEWRRLVQQYVFQTAAPITKTGTATIDTTTITAMNNTTNLAAQMVVSGNGLNSFTTVLSVDSGTQVTVDMASASTAAGASLSFMTQDYALPSGFDRMISDTSFDRTDHWSNLGSKSSQEWQFLNGGVVSTSPRFRYRIYGNKLRLWPAPADVLNMAYEYVSGFWVTASGGAAPTKAAGTADTDTCIFPDDVMVLGIKWQWYKTNNLDYATPLAEFMRAVGYAKGQDEPAPKLSLDPAFGEILVEPNAIPDGNWTL